MKVLCYHHQIPMVLYDDEQPDGNESHGLCADCATNAKLLAAFIRDAYLNRDTNPELLAQLRALDIKV